MRNGSLRRWLSRLHLWAGLSVGLIFALLGISGAVLVFHNPLLRWQYPQLAEHAPVAHAQVLHHISQSPHANDLSSLDLPRPALPVWQGHYRDGSRGYFAPDDGRLLLIRRPGKDWLMFLHDFHVKLLAGKPGREVLGILAWPCLLLLLTGLYLWWPKPGGFWLSLRWYRQPALRRWHSWHQSTGALILPMLLLLVLTGLSFVYPNLFRIGLTSVFGGTPLPMLEEPAANHADVDWQTVLESAQQALPDARIHRVSLPQDDKDAVNIRLQAAGEWHPNGRSQVIVSRDGKTLHQVVDARRQALGQRIQMSFYPLHIGAVGGLAMQIFTALAGLAAAFLFFTGLMRWWRGRPAG
ncbi:peptidase [Lysobacteraceae bacterium NML120232]|nr:peptidase [Xanthomonadaceae bacterium NML08-0793]PJK11648.1 peptidase [Xanthomonadaceae bacterium NML120232]